MVIFFTYYILISHYNLFIYKHIYYHTPYKNFIAYFFFIKIQIIDNIYPCIFITIYIIEYKIIQYNSHHFTSNI